MLSSVKSLGGFSALLMVAMVAAGCRSNEPIRTSGFDDTSNTNTTSSRGINDGGTLADGLPDVDQDQLLFGESGLQTVYFDYNSFALRDDTRRLLQANANQLKNTPGVMIQIEGHCDERGTQEYNLALGEKRALAVREYLVSLGVAPSRIITISYGEEMPAVQGSNEAAWSKNRRAEFNKAM